MAFLTGHQCIKTEPEKAKMSSNGTRKNKTYLPTSVYTNRVLRDKPVRNVGQDLRDLPTYTLPIAGKSLAVPRRTMHNWFSGSRPILHPSGHVGTVALLSFKDLAEAYVLEVLRTVYGFPLSALRDVLENAKKETRLARPLIDADLRVVLRNLVMHKPARGKLPRRSVDLAHHRNLVFNEFVDMIGHRILKDKKNVPYRLYPWRFMSPEDDSCPVTVDPEVMSGRAVVTGTRIPLDVLEGMQRSGRSPENIAQLYEIEVDIVRKALLHIERPIHTKAA